MQRKKCTLCGKYSYSAATESGWICPYCGEDLTGVLAEPAVTDREETGQLKAGQEA